MLVATYMAEAGGAEAHRPGSVGVGRGPGENPVESGTRTRVACVREIGCLVKPDVRVACTFDYHPGPSWTAQVNKFRGHSCAEL